jgi:hypothetical protein
MLRTLAIAALFVPLFAVPAHAKCKADDSGNCHPDPPLPPQPPPKLPHGTIYPNYYLLTILYPPPGNGSEVDYGAGSSTGSKTSSQATVKSGFVMEAEAGDVEIDSKFTVGSTLGGATEITKTSTNTLKLTSRADAIDHMKDEFVLWMNPAITVDGTSATSYGFLVGPTAGAPMSIVNVTAEELLDPTKMTDWRRAATASLTDADRAQILALDPLIHGNVSTQPGRYQLLRDSFQLEGPDHPTDPIFAQGIELEDETVNSTTIGWSAGTEIEFKVGTDFSFFGLLSAGLKVGGSWEFEYEQEHESSSGTKQSISMSLQTDTVGYYALYDVYLDTAFNSFAFVPHRTLIGPIVSGGVYLSANGQPVTNQMVRVTLADGTRRWVHTDANGSYKLVSTPVLDPIPVRLMK